MFKQKILLIGLLITALTLFLTGCSSKPEINAKDTMNIYVNAVKTGDTTELAKVGMNEDEITAFQKNSMLSKQAQDIMETQFKSMGITLSTEDSDKIIAVVSKMRQSADITIEPVNETVDKATFKVSVKGIDRNRFTQAFTDKITAFAQSPDNGLRPYMRQSEVAKIIVPQIITILDELSQNVPLVQQPMTFEVNLKLNKDKNVWEPEDNTKFVTDIEKAIFYNYVQ